MPPDVSASSAAEAVDRVLTPAFLGHLGRMRLNVRRAFGPRPGDTPVRGLVQYGGLELERHKEYGHGDELRHLDWNAYARLDQLLVRQFRAEREAPVHVFVDASASMDTPGGDGKLSFAAGLALALAYVAIRHHNPTRIVVLADGGEGYRASPVVRFPARLPILSEICASLRGGGPTTLERGVGSYVRAQTTPGLALLISDFLIEPDSARDVFQLLAARGYEVAAFRPIGPGERDPSSLFQRARVRDAEDGQEKIVRLTPANLARYQEALAEHLADLERWCTENEAVFTACDTGAGLEHCLFTRLPQLGVLR